MVYIIFDREDNILICGSDKHRINKWYKTYIMFGIDCYCVQMTYKEYNKYLRKLLDNLK